MSNNLPPVGFEYTIDDSGVNQSADRITKANNRIAQSLLNLIGVGGQSARAIGALGAAALPVAGGLVAIAGAAAGAKIGIDVLQTSFEKHQNTLALTTRSYEAFYHARIRALNTPAGAATAFESGFESLKQAAFDQTGRLIGESLGRAISEGMAGVLTPGRLVELLAPLTQSPLEFFGKILRDAQRKYIAAQQEIATAQFVNAAATRAAAASIQEEINRLLLAGATVDQLIPKYYELLKARAAFEVPVRGAGAVGAGSTGRGAMSPPTGSDIEAAIARDAAYRQTTLAQNLYRDLLAVQTQFNSQSQEAAADHQSRLADIAEQGAERRASIERNLAERLADIDAHLNRTREDAARDLAERFADAEAAAQDRRANLAERFADRRAQIEATYQERVRDVNEQYGASVLDATIRRDATALLRAKDAKARGLRDAEQARTKDNASAQKDYDRDRRELDESLAKQKAALERDYQRRLRDAAEQAERQRTQAKQDAARQLDDLARSQAAQYAAEAKSYRERQAALAAAHAARKAALVAALAEEKNLTEAQAKAIIESLKGILNPAQITELLKQLQQAIQAKIDITITPFVAKSGGGTSNPDTGPVMAMGGYKAASGGAYLHAGEWVLPNPVTAGMSRFTDVLTSALRQYSVPTARLAGRGGGDSRVTVEVLLNDGMLDARIVRGAVNASVRVMKGSTPR